MRGSGPIARWLRIVLSAVASVLPLATGAGLLLEVGLRLALGPQLVLGALAVGVSALSGFGAYRAVGSWRSTRFTTVIQNPRGLVINGTTIPWHDVRFVGVAGEDLVVDWRGGSPIRIPGSGHDARARVQLMLALRARVEAASAGESSRLEAHRLTGTLTEKS